MKVNCIRGYWWIIRSLIYLHQTKSNSLMLNLYLKYSQTPLFLLHSDKVSDAAAVQEIDDMEPESKRRKTDCGKMSTEAWTSCYSVSGCMMFVLADSSSDLPHTSTTAGGGLDKTGVRNDVAKPPVDGTKTDKMEESLTCVICQDLLHDCIRFVAFILWPWLGYKERCLSWEMKWMCFSLSLQPCMHVFCAACYSGWMERSSLCPTCRCPVERIRKNHILNNLVEAYLLQHPGLLIHLAL